MLLLRTNLTGKTMRVAEGRAQALVFGAAVMVALLVGLLLGAKPAHSVGPFVVDSTGDENDLDFPGGTFDGSSDGKCDVDSAAGDQCTLRAAIQEANVNNNDPTVDVINFAIPGAGPHTISPTSALPDIAEAVTINGYSESLDETTPASANTLAVGNNAVLKIVLSGADAPTNPLNGQKPSGLKIEATHSTVQGLVISNWENGVLLGTGATDDQVMGNYIGTDVTGTVTNPDGIPFNGDELGNNGGVAALDGNNTIGGTTPAARNVISGNGAGVLIASANGGNQVMGNYIGTNVNGTEPLGNTNGVVIQSGPNNTIGGTTAAKRNIISGNSTFGILISSPGATDNQVMGNYIGTNATGTVTDPDGIPNNGDESGNIEDGVRIHGDADNNTIGGTTTGAGNLISGNGGDGVEVRFALSDPNQGATGNSILSNSIYSNDELGIDLVHENNLNEEATCNDPGDNDVGPNNLQNYPIITSAKLATKRIGGHRRKVTLIKGTLNSIPSTPTTGTPAFTLQFFSSPEADHPSGPPPCGPASFGEGKTFLGQKSVQTDTDGNATFTFFTKKKVPTGQVVTATATNQTTGDTSEFSEAVPVS